MREAADPEKQVRACIYLLAGRDDVLCTLDRDFFEEHVLGFAKRHGIQIPTDLQLHSELAKG